MAESASIVIASHGPLSSNSGVHVLAVAREVAERGFPVTVVVPDGCEGDPGAEPPVDGIRIRGRERWLREPGRAPSLVHVWTPREGMREFHAGIEARFGGSVPYLVHLEDNEEILLRSQTGLSPVACRELRDGHRSFDVPPHLTHPGLGLRFLQRASGVTALISSLLRDVPAGVPTVTFWPGHDPAFRIRRPDAAGSVRRRLGIPEGTLVVTYTGNVHAANVAEVRSLYLAVALANRMGLPVRLLRTGRDFVPLAEHGLDELRVHAIELGVLPRGELPGLVQAADLLVQPGRRDEWNSFRVPSKLPEYLASGRPVVLPRVNLGEELEHGWNAIVLEEATAEAILAALLEWAPRRERLSAIGAEGATFAARHLSWSVAGESVVGLYRRILAGRPVGGPVRGISP